MKPETYTALFLEYQQPLCRYLTRISGSKEIAEELLQETFYRAMLSLRQGELRQVRPWLYKVARHLYIDWQRKQAAEQKMRERVEREAEGVSPYGNPEQSLQSSERKARIQAILRQMPERMRTILYLREIEEFSYQELADTLDLSMSQVKVYLHRARERFRQLSEESGRRSADEQR